MSGIRISPKHGVNPCIPICVFCGQEKNQIALLGMLKGDAEAPMSAVIDYEPCEECQKNWSMGVALIRVSETPLQKDMPPLMERDGKRLYPTAQYSVITPDAAQRIFGIEGAQAGNKLLMDAADFDEFMRQAEQAGAVEQP